MTPLLIFILSHLATDFVFQSDALVAKKKQARAAIWALVQHGLIHLVISTWLFVLTKQLDLKSLLLILCLSIIHILVDQLKQRLSRGPMQASLILFVLDQLLHFALIFGLTRYFYPGDWFRLGIYDRWLGIAIGLVFSLPTAGIVIGLILDKLRYREQHLQTDQPAIGRYIGYLERVLIIFFVLAHSIAGLGLLATFKTLARFRQLEDQAFSEYYILGTLLSLVFGIMGAYIIRLFVWLY